MKLSDEQIKEIAGELEIGMVCYIHRKTGELVSFPNPEQFYDGDFEAWQEDMDKVENNGNDYFAIRAMKSFEAYQVMEDFAETIEDPIYKGRFFERLSLRKPFANFNHLVHNSPYREDWFAFKTQSFRTFVQKQLEEEE